MCGVVPQVDLPVVGVDEHDARLVGAGFGVLHRPVRDHDDQITGMHEMGSRTIDPDHAAAAFAGDGVCDQPSAIVDVDDGHLFTLEQVGGLHQVGVDRHRANVV